MQSYIERSRQIRNLSMPPENKEHFYGQFRSTFCRYGSYLPKTARI